MSFVPFWVDEVLPPPEFCDPNRPPRTAPPAAVATSLPMLCFPSIDSPRQAIGAAERSVWLEAEPGDELPVFGWVVFVGLQGEREDVATLHLSDHGPVSLKLSPSERREGFVDEAVGEAVPIVFFQSDGVGSAAGNGDDGRRRAR